MGKCFQGKLIFVLVLISFLALFSAASTLACNGGGGGGGGGGGESESTPPSTGITIDSIENAELATFEEQAQFAQYNEGLDRIDGEFQPIGHEENPQQTALDRAEFFAWLSDRTEAAGDGKWGGLPGTTSVGGGPPGSKNTESVDVITSVPDLAGLATCIVWNATLNTSRTLGYGMMGGNNRTVYNINQQSRSGRAINHFIANSEYHGRQRSGPGRNGNSYNVLGGGHNEAPRAE